MGGSIVTARGFQTTSICVPDEFETWIWCVDESMQYIRGFPFIPKFKSQACPIVVSQAKVCFSFEWCPGGVGTGRS
jgi:hypothetical protein